MKQVLQHVKTGDLTLAEVPTPKAISGGVLVRNAASLISAGTERMLVDFAGKSMLGKARERPDLVRQVVDKAMRDGVGATLQTVMTRLDQPLPLGYSCAGIVEEVASGVSEFGIGQRVACAGMGYASHAEYVRVPRNLTVPIPDNVSFNDASYVTLGAIALQGVRIADVRLGESVAVIGLGLLGQISVQLLKANGCRVIGIDLDPDKVQRARALGADAAINRSDDVEAAIDAFTAGQGVDAVVIAAATDSNDPITLAGDIARDRAVVSMVGAVSMDIPRKTYYEKELQLRLSRSYGPGRYDPSYEEGGNDYPIGYVRWTEKRNMEEFLRLISDGKVTPSELTTHTFPIAAAEDAYELISGKTEVPYLGIVLEYPKTAAPQVRRVDLKAGRAVKGDKVGVGFIGAGNFAQAVLLPHFQSSDAASLVGLSTGTGVTAKSAGEKFGFAYGTTDTAEVLNDASVDAVVIATRHSSHADLAARALEAGKSVFVEKPLAITEESLEHLIEVADRSEGVLTVGFNRRFSPHAAKIRQAFPADQPLAITYRINAGAIPAESWIQDPEVGGGRVIGEVCHFVDLVSFLADSPLDEVFAYSLGGHAGSLDDTVTIVLRYQNGTIANINYFSTGDKAFGKEYLEVYGGGKIAILEDFRRLTITANGKKTRDKGWSQQKGFKEEVDAFLQSVKSGRASIPYDSIISTTRATFAILESLKTNQPVRIGSS